MRNYDSRKRILVTGGAGFLGSRSAIVKKPMPADDPAQRQPDIALARKNLGWEPKVQLDEGLARTITCFEALLSEQSAGGAPTPDPARSHSPRTR